MKRKTKLALAACVVAVLLFTLLVGVSVWEIFSPNSPRNRSSALECTQEWARLAPFPAEAKDLRITTRGSMFTREFTVTFTAPAEVVAAWLAQCPGPRSVAPTTLPDGSRRYAIPPAAGAQFAELTLSPDGTRVTVRTFWS